MYEDNDYHLRKSSSTPDYEHVRVHCNGHNNTQSTRLSNKLYVKVKAFGRDESTSIWMNLGLTILLKKSFLFAKHFAYNETAIDE